MALISSKELLQKAYREKYAVGAFNVNDMEIIQGIVEAARQEKSPLILLALSRAVDSAKRILIESISSALLEAIF